MASLSSSFLRRSQRGLFLLVAVLLHLLQSQPSSALSLSMMQSLSSSTSTSTMATPTLTTGPSARLYHTYKNPSIFPGEARLAYTQCLPPPTPATSKSPVVCIHGFGGNADQFRKNLPALAAAGHKTYALDLLGYGYSSKPSPRAKEVNQVYNFENWAESTVDLMRNVVKEPAYLVCNSVGGVVGLQAAKQHPDLIKGVILIDVSLRLLHVKKQNPVLRPFVSWFQTTLRETPAGAFFFKQVAQPKAIQNILSQAYASPVDDETVSLILSPGLQPGAVEVFLDFISYSGGPLPEELLAELSSLEWQRKAKTNMPVRLLWGENDPWEPIEMGREAFANYGCVDGFVTLEGGGHCPMDQVPERVNAEILRFVSQ